MHLPGTGRDRRKVDEEKSLSKYSAGTLPCFPGVRCFSKYASNCKTTEQQPGSNADAEIFCTAAGFLCPFGSDSYYMQNHNKT